MRGDFAWLTSPAEPDHNIGNEKVAENAGALPHLIEAAGRDGIALPAEFVAFLTARDLQQRIRSNTDCFVDLCPDLVPSPIGSGYLVRFLADSQGCVFWYLYLTRDGLDHAVVSSPGFYGAEAEQWGDEPPDPSDIVFAAQSFEAFMCRFWLENEIWFSAYQETPMPDVCQEYVDSYQNRNGTDA